MYDRLTNDVHVWTDELLLALLAIPYKSHQRHCVHRHYTILSARQYRAAYDVI